MSQYFTIHPDNPQPRLIRQAVEIVKQGGLIIYPTDSVYALGCQIGDKEAMDRIRRLRKIDDTHNFTLVCRDLSDISTYAKVDNSSFRLLKTATPGPYTFILPATREVPRRLQNPKRKTIGIRIPDNRITQALLDDLGEPLMTSTLLLPEHPDIPLDELWQIRELLEHQVDLIIDGGGCGLQPTTVVDMTDTAPTIAREGKGDVATLGL